MSEFADIFAAGLTSTIYLSTSLAILLALAAIAVGMTHQPSRHSDALSLRRAV
jgi:hypothetical protein